jgi:hypothetical protein
VNYAVTYRVKILINYAKKSDGIELLLYGTNQKRQLKKTKTVSDA